MMAAPAVDDVVVMNLGRPKDERGSVKSYTKQPPLVSGLRSPTQKKHDLRTNSF